MNAVDELLLGERPLGRPKTTSFENGVLRITTTGGFVLVIPCRLVGPLDRYLAQLGDA